MTQIQRSALVAFSDQQMFDLVNDIEAYPHYMDGCIGAEVLERAGSTLVARLDLNKLGMRYSFTTRNQLTAPTLMEMQLVEGPFQRLSGSWSFLSLTEGACKVSLKLEFELSGGLVARAAGRWLDAVANDLVDGLCQRAKWVYGPAAGQR